MDTFGTLKIFVHVADARSFTVAGRQLGLSSSAAGKALTRLEEHLGVRLLHRSTRSVTLTPEGNCFLERSRRILGEFEAAEREVAITRQSPSGTLRVSLPLAGMLMMPALSAFMLAYPEVELDLDFTDRLVDVIDEGLDVVIRAGEVRDSRLMTRTLGQFRLMLVCSPRYVARSGMPRQPADLRHHACLHHRYATSGKLEPWPIKSSQNAIDLPRRAVANTIEPLIDMAERGLGIACLPDFAIRDQLRTGLLTAVLEDHTRHEGTFRLLWPSSRYMSPKLRVFVDYMSEHLIAGSQSPSRTGPMDKMPSSSSNSGAFHVLTKT
ncbi:LysR family transcriptional regulator [Phyllobacterium sp. SB3]|uniref:LysR family transcriptional regulator n=1 Tax=Phyllobacterium sp. SB3 TaxID=3156073 RepID=UPI0032AFC2F2